MLLHHKKVAIIGAGPVGLTFAKLLQQEGVDVNVYERDDNEFVRIKGGTLDIHQNLGQKALEKAGLLAEFYRYSRPTGERAADIHGNILSDSFPDTAYLYDRPEIDRNDLRKLLIHNLEPDTVIWGSKLVALEKDIDKFILHFDNGVTETADLVVGANGGMSCVRQYITDVKPQYTGTIIIQGEVLQPDKSCPNFKKLCGTGNLGVAAQRIFLFSQTKASGALNYYVSFRTPETWIERSELDFNNRQEVCSFLTELVYSWHDVYKELFAATDEFTLLPMRVLPLERREVYENITLIGDAAHVMPPFAGIGVNIGLLDALYLAENLTNGLFADIPSAIGHYEEKMYQYASKAQQDTNLAEITIHSDRDFEEIIKVKY